MHRDHPVTDHAAVVDSDTQLIDVREPDEVAEGTIQGSKNIPLSELPERIGELDRSKRVALFCRSGGRSTKACELLTEAGFADVVNLAGGMLAIEEQG